MKPRYKIDLYIGVSSGVKYYGLYRRDWFTWRLVDFFQTIELARSRYKLLTQTLEGVPEYLP